MSATYVGKRKRMRVCTSVDPPVFPSRVCRFLGHHWYVTHGESWKGNPEWWKCQRCGAQEAWYDYGSNRALEVLADAALGEDA